MSKKQKRILYLSLMLVFSLSSSIFVLILSIEVNNIKTVWYRDSSTSINESGLSFSKYPVDLYINTYQIDTPFFFNMTKYYNFITSLRNRLEDSYLTYYFDGLSVNFSNTSEFKTDAVPQYLGNFTSIVCSSIVFSNETFLFNQLSDNSIFISKSLEEKYNISIGQKVDISLVKEVYNDTFGKPILSNVTMVLKDILVQGVVPSNIALSSSGTIESSLLFKPWHAVPSDFIILNANLLYKLAKWDIKPPKPFFSTYRSVVTGYFNFSYSYLGNYFTAYSRASKLTNEILLFFYQTLAEEGVDTKHIQVYNLYSMRFASARGNWFEAVLSQSVLFLFPLFFGMLLVLLLYERVIISDSYPSLNLLSSRGATKKQIFVKLVKRDLKLCGLLSQLFVIAFGTLTAGILLLLSHGESYLSESILIDVLVLFIIYEIISIPFFILFFLGRIYIKNRYILAHKGFLWYTDTINQHQESLPVVLKKDVKQKIIVLASIAYSTFFPFWSYGVYKTDAFVKMPVHTVYLVKNLCIALFVLYCVALIFLTMQLFKKSSSLIIQLFSISKKYGQIFRKIFQRTTQSQKYLSKILVLLVLCNVFPLYWLGYYSANAKNTDYFYGCDIEISINSEYFAKLNYSESSFISHQIFNELKHIEGVDYVIPYYSIAVTGPAYPNRNITLHLLPLKTLIELHSKYPDALPTLKQSHISAFQELHDDEILVFDKVRLKGLTNIGDLYNFSSVSTFDPNKTVELNYRVHNFITYFTNKLKGSFGVANLTDTFFDNFPIKKYYVKAIAKANIEEIVAKIRAILPYSIYVSVYGTGEYTETMEIHTIQSYQTTETTVINFIRTVSIILFIISSIIVLLLFNVSYQSSAGIRKILISRGARLRNSILPSMMLFVLKFIFIYVSSNFIIGVLMLGVFALNYITHYTKFGAYFIYTFPKFSSLFMWIGIQFAILIVLIIGYCVFIYRRTTVTQLFTETQNFVSKHFMK